MHLHQVYTQVHDPGKLITQVQSYLDDYNAMSTAPMRLVLFLDAVDHVARICRVLRQPQGNMLLLGVGGSGRKSLARLAAHICDAEVVQIEITKGYGHPEWREVRGMRRSPVGCTGANDVPSSAKEHAWCKLHQLVPVR